MLFRLRPNFLVLSNSNSSGKHQICSVVSHHTAKAQPPTPHVSFFCLKVYYLHFHSTVTLNTTTYPLRQTHMLTKYTVCKSQLSVLITFIFGFVLLIIFHTSPV